MSLAGVLAALLIGASTPAEATSYVLIPDGELLARSQVVVRVRAGASRVRASSELVAETVTEAEVLDAVRGHVASRVEIVLPGGLLEDGTGARYFGVPELEAGREYLLCLVPGTDGRYTIAELALGAFDVMRDAGGRRYAVRAAFLSGAIQPLAATEQGLEAEPVRDLALFTEHIRDGKVRSYLANPASPLVSVTDDSGIRPLWLAFQSSGATLRWRNGAEATVSHVDDFPANGTAQSGVAGGGLAQLQAAVDTWVNDPTSSIGYSTTSGAGVVTVHLDNVSEFGGTGIPCSLGVIGLAGPSYSVSPQTFKGEPSYAITGGRVFMRRWDCAQSAYRASAFQNGLAHELGHTLGFDHSDKGQSPHDTTSNAQGSLMLSVGDFGRPTGLGTDDVEAACWMYGSCGVATDTFEETRVVPIVLDVAGKNGARFTSELTLANSGTTRAALSLTYTAAATLGASGSGTVTDSLAPGQQRVYSSALAYLRSRGLAIPLSGNQGGTLRIRFTGLSSKDAAFAGARTTSPSGRGRAGLYATAPRVEDLASTEVRLFGLRETSADRTNLGLANVGLAGSITLRVTVFAGDGSGRTSVLPDVVLGPGQWRQLDSVLAPLGYANALARVRRVSGADPFVAYAVVNDNVTNDGSYVPAAAGAAAPEVLTLPVVVETGTFSSELVLANPTFRPVEVWLEYVESLEPPLGSVGPVTLVLAAYEQRFIPSAMELLRERGIPLSRGADRAGTLTASFLRDGSLAEGFLGARTSASAAVNGRYGLYYPAVGAGKAARGDAWVFGLSANATTRSHVAFSNLDAAQSVSLKYAVLDGASGASRATGSVTLPPGGWLQVNNVLASAGVTTGFVHVTRVSGTAPFAVYGVLNDGASPAAGTDDGSYVGMDAAN